MTARAIGAHKVIARVPVTARVTTGAHLRIATVAMVHKEAMVMAHRTVTMVARAAMVIRETMVHHRRAVA